MSDKLEAVEAATQWRRDEVQALGAALSCRDWHMMEKAYNSLRDKMDGAFIDWSRTPTPEQAGEVSDATKRMERTLGARFTRRASTPPAQPTAAVDAKDIAAAVVQSVCETDPADPEHPDTVSIEVSDLETIVRQAVENATEATMASDYVMVPREPTEAMIDAVGFLLPRIAREYWSAMLSAASPTGGV